MQLYLNVYSFCHIWLFQILYLLGIEDVEVMLINNLYLSHRTKNLVISNDVVAY